MEEKEDIVANKPRPQKVYSSILVKAVNGFDQVVDSCNVLLKSTLVIITQIKESQVHYAR